MKEPRASNELTPDQLAAHEFLSELRTRITTQPLPYQYGVEAKALESLWQIFVQARAAMRNNPGCNEFAEKVTRMLNVDLRPVTAKWDRAYTEGRLKSRDGANEFRADLDAVQIKLRRFARDMHHMAYGTDAYDDLSPPALTAGELEECFADVPFGITTAKTLISDDLVSQINASEREAVARRRQKYKIATSSGKNAVGLGLSGGGIRSATFCLGVVQVLASRDLLKEVDLLSTVSGGGYVGCFLTSRLGGGEPQSNVANPHGPDTDPVRYLRQHAKYLSASDLKEQWSMVTATLAGMVLNWTAPLFLIALATLIAIAIHEAHFDPPWPKILAASGGLTLLSLVNYAFLIRFARKYTGGRILAATTALTLAIGFGWLLTAVYQYLNARGISWPWGTTGILALASAFPAVLRFMPILKNPTVRRRVLKTMLFVAGFIIPIGAIALSFLFFHLGTQGVASTAPEWNPLRYVPGAIVLAALTLFFGLVAATLLNVNLTAPHRLYRDQLARTFVQTSEEDTTSLLLTNTNLADLAPYHLINAAVNLPSSTSAALRERKSDFFLFSKHWCGAPSIGYFPTVQWKGNRRPVDVATAMAVSGAAVSSYMGLELMPSLTALLTFLNVRLGFWILRPNKQRLLKTPGFLCLIREMTGIAMSEKQGWLNLSDGGHIENMGVYELLRRRCKYIISIDGEADPQSTFQGHLTLVRHAMIDFGIRIEPNLNSLRPDLTSRFSQTHFMLSRVHYPAAGTTPAGCGFILYMKLSVTGNELELVKRYRALHPDFPHETTLDQFFSEEQFEVYRQLGVHVAEGLFSPVLTNNANPTTVPQWFRGLAQNLLEPEQV